MKVSKSDTCFVLGLGTSDFGLWTLDIGHYAWEQPQRLGCLTSQLLRPDGTGHKGGAGDV